MMTRSQTPDTKRIGSSVISLARSARVPPKIRGIRYVKPRRLCDEYDNISPVKKYKVLRSGHQPPSKSSPPKGSKARKESVPDVSLPKALPCVTPRSGVDVNVNNSDDDSYNHCLPHAWNTPQYRAKCAH